MFNSRQGVNEGIASWSSRIDSMQSDFREAAYRICTDEEIEEIVGTMGLINHLAKACFVQGLSNDRKQTIVGAKGETTLLSACIDSALEEESAILSVKERGFAASKSNDKRVFEGSGRGSWVRNPRSENGGFAE
jgi:hypothetical protein